MRFTGQNAKETTAARKCFVFVWSLLLTVETQLHISAFATTETNEGVERRILETCVNEVLYCPELDSCLDPYEETCPLDLSDDEVQEFNGPQRLLCYASDGNARCDLSGTMKPLTIMTSFRF
mmetsp:Transcript_26748/g.63797  ORF Transcript_26748/g.63797 Transcript_26748/m.63797 type:complete len:122 (-) Transcript_26748:777-1142(-)